ncbi:hypothetical protein CEXT_493011 [Caerostris extrusa]|uniref:Uncharacterized protein n=1 Tax=Caerostris extrusa TaxID=172846 RepID=A0AAV4YCU7_CAEEX|nr:hypothetical protein CEXT_493011 [Caerostris extrusa]
MNFKESFSSLTPFYHAGNNAAAGELSMRAILGERGLSLCITGQREERKWKNIRKAKVGCVRLHFVRRECLTDVVRRLHYSLLTMVAPKAHMNGRQGIMIHVEERERDSTRKMNFKRVLALSHPFTMPVITLLVNCSLGAILGEEVYP